MLADHEKVDRFYLANRKRAIKTTDQNIQSMLLIQLSPCIFHLAHFPSAPLAYAAALTMPCGWKVLPAVREDSCLTVTVCSRAEGDEQAQGVAGEALGRPQGRFLTRQKPERKFY